jgi:hypothetical protein
VTNVVSRAKKTFANEKLPVLNQTILDLSNRCRDIWLLYKQIWYVPFIWSLSWYSFWIVHSAVVFNKPLVQGNPLNFFGAIISIAALLLAVPRFRTIIRKTSVLVGVHIKSRRIGFSWRKKLVQNIQVEKPMQQKLQVKYQSPIKRNQTANLERPKQLKQPSSSLRALSGSTNYSNQHQLSQEIPAECLTCANLISCDYRQNRSVDSETQVQKRVPCRFAVELSINKAVAS